MTSTCNEVKDTLLKSVHVAEDMAKEKIKGAQQEMNNQLDDALVMVYRQAEKVSNQAQSGIDAINKAVQGGVNKAADFVTDILDKTIEKVEETLGKVAKFMK